MKQIDIDLQHINFVALQKLVSLTLDSALSR
jgi:hypothetical protein